MPDVVGVIGAGLIGASILARAATVWPSARLMAFDTSEAHREQLGRRFPGVLLVQSAEALRACDLVFVCTPVSAIAGYVALLCTACDGPVVVDTGSVKASVVKAVAAGGVDTSRYVPGHPLAGSHQSGPLAGTADIIEGRGFILTPGESTSAEALALARTWLGELGARVAVTTPERHDAMLALTSHLPHVIAYALAETFFSTADNSPEDVSGLIAGSFRAQTVFAASDPRMWADILVANRAALAAALDAFVGEVQEFKALALAGDAEAIMARIASIRDRRKAIGD